MSIDYDAFCDQCNEVIHIGQSSGGRWSFGYSLDDGETIRAQGRWIEEHVDHGVTIIDANNTPESTKRAEVASDELRRT